MIKNIILKIFANKGLLQKKSSKHCQKILKLLRISHIMYNYDKRN